MNQIQNEINSMIRDFHKNNDGINREDYSYKEAITMDNMYILEKAIALQKAIKERVFY